MHCNQCLSCIWEEKAAALPPHSNFLREFFTMQPGISEKFFPPWWKKNAFGNRYSDNGHPGKRIGPNTGAHTGPEGDMETDEGLRAQSAIAGFFEGPNGEANKKLMTNVCIFGAACLVLHHW